MDKISARSVRNVLVVGSWAKEQITIENIRRNTDARIYAYMDTLNPGIAALVDAYEIDSLYNVKRIVDYARKVKANLLIVTTAAPLSVGVADELERANVAVFGPNRVAARLESDKAFARTLMDRHEIDALPAFRVFNEFAPAVDYARSYDWNVAVKPISLTDGLGVKVYGDQLTNSAEVIDYIDEVLNMSKGGGRVLIEEKLEGEEFTLQCFVNGDHIVPTPAVQDFKKLLPGDEGVNTASMGSYMSGGYLLPFLQQEDYDRALEIIKKTVNAFENETGAACRGILYGQFMLTASGVRLIEYNFRPGDPEWLNVMIAMKSSVLDVIIKVLRRERVNLKFEPKPTVCKYVVPMGYPDKMNETLDFRYDSKEFARQKVAIYHSCGVDEENRIKVGNERGIALVAKGDTIFDANRRIERALATAKGNFYYRPDIGSRETIRIKIAHANKLRALPGKPEVQIRQAAEDDFLRVHQFISKLDVVEHYPEHIYKIMLRNFSKGCFIAEKRNRIAGFVMGFRSLNDEGTYFMWQIGVAPSMRGKGTGSNLVAATEQQAKALGCRRIEVTIDPKNKPSQRMFEHRGYENVSSKEGKTVRSMGKIAAKDFYKPKRHFIVYEKRI